MRYPTKTLLILAAAVLVASAVFAQTPTKTKKATTAEMKPAAKKAEVEWLGYDEGLAKAAKEDKPVMINFYTSWCGYCKKMDRSTFKDPKVIDFLEENFVTVRINAESKEMVSHEGEQVSLRRLARLYGVRGYPTFWFLDSNGDRIGPAPGFKTAETFLPLLRYVGGSHYKTMSYENFVKKDEGKG
jgi:thioredoxin-related protein